MELIPIVHELRLAKGSKKKLSILKRENNNPLWKKFLKYTYDPFISYGVHSPHDFNFDTLDISEKMFSSFDLLSSRKVTGNEAKSLVKELSSAYGEIPRIILDRTLKAGVSIKTINKAYPGLVTVWESMKGKDVPIVEFPIMSSIKYDGVKVFVKVKGSSTTLYTSSGLEFKLDSLADEFKNAVEGMYEGEFTYKQGKIVHRPAITGVLNSLLAGTEIDTTHCKYRIYDWIPLSEWDSGIFEKEWWYRHKVLVSQFTTGFQDSAKVKLVEHHYQTELQEQVEMFEYLTESGYEGTMSRYTDDPYVFNRVDRLIKKKSIQECALKCIGTKPHSNPAKGIVGSLILEGDVYDKKTKTTYFIRVSTGSGLSKFDINLEPERYVGNDIEMCYNSVTTTDTGHSLFLPRFKRIVKS